ncbi:MAG: hypothetical protein IJT77_11235 [Clostridia bacterium]|nr:hypothetical protein [Clostridia bacterium]
MTFIHSACRRTAALFLGLMLALFLLPAGAPAQSVRMDSGYAAFEYPDSWLVLSPQLCRVYAPILEAQGLDPEALRKDMEKTYVLSCAYNADFTQRMAVLVFETETSQRIFNIENAETGERRRIRGQVENNSLWNSSGYKTQDAEWQNTAGRYWLYVHYTRTENGETVGRGLRYMTIHNGQFVALDWQIRSGRFTNRDLSTFKSKLQGLVFLEDIEEPMHEVTLVADLPTETINGKLEITGTATPGAEITLMVENETVARKTVAETTAGSSGSFKLPYTLESEGEIELILTAHVEGMLDKTLQSYITYNAKTLPVSGIDENITTSEDTVVISGKTLAGTQLQLVTPFGLSKKRAWNDGSFSFELNTKEEGTYDYTLLLEKGSYVQRRFNFTVVRIKTDDQQHDDIRKTAVRLKYKELQKDLESNLGKVMNLYGPVTEVSTGGGTTYIRMQFTKVSGQNWTNPIIVLCDENPGVEAGNYISAVVTVEGVYVEQDDAGKDVNVPRFRLLFVDRIE